MCQKRREANWTRKSQTAIELATCLFRDDGAQACARLNATAGICQKHGSCPRTVNHKPLEHVYNWHAPSQQSDVLRLMEDIADSFGRKDAGHVNDAQDGEQQVWKSKVVACLLPGLGVHPMASSSFPVAHQLSPTWLGMTSQSTRAFAGLSTRAAAARPPAQAPSHRPTCLKKSGRGSKQAQKSRKHVKNHATPNKRKTQQNTATVGDI